MSSPWATTIASSGLNSSAYPWVGWWPVQIIEMSRLRLELLHAFGSTCGQHSLNCIGIAQEDKNEVRVLFPVGKALAKKSIDRAEMSFVHFAQDTDRIESMCMLPTREHVAVAYQPHGSQLQAIKIYGFGGEEPISIQIFQEQEKMGCVRLMAFSPSEPKFMCVLLGEPHCKLLFIDTFKNKALAESGFVLKDVDQISICPHNSHLICVSGGSALRLFKVEEYTFKPLEDVRKMPKGRRITSHAWYKRRMIVAATDKCELLVLEEVRPNLFETRQEYLNVFNEAGTERAVVTAICPFSRGVILGSHDGKFCLWTRREESSNEGEEGLELSRKWATTEERAAPVTNIVMGPREDILAISLGNNDVATLYLSELIPQVSDLINEVSEKEIVFEYVYKGFHNHGVSGMDICEQRPLVATVSHQDSTLRVWNYKNYGCALLRMFYFKLREEADSERPLLTLAFHPSGYYLALACTDKLRFFHVLSHELRPYRELGVRNAHILKFSRGGNLLAACYPLREDPAQDHIKLFNALTLEELVVFKDHLSVVRSLEFKRFDESLLAVGAVGTIIEWRLSDWARTKQLHTKGMQYRCGLYWHSRNSIVTFGSHQGRRYLEEHGCETSSVSQHELDAEVVAMAQLRVGREKALLLALADGKLVVFGGLQRPVVMDSKNIHLKQVTSMALSPCGKYVMTAGEDCLVLVFKLQLEVEGIVQEEEHSSIIVDDFLADVVLINRKEILKVSEKEQEYTKVIGNLGKKLKMLMDERLKKHRAKIVEVEVQKNRLVDDVSYRIQRLQNQVELLQDKGEASFSTLDKNHLAKAETLEQSFEQKISFEVEKHFQLEQELIQIRLLHQREIEAMKRLEEVEIGRLKDEFEGKFKESEQVYSESKKESERAGGIFEDRTKQIEEEQEEEIKEVQAKKHKFRLEMALAIQELFERQGKLRKEHARLTEQRNQERKKNEDRAYSRTRMEKEAEEAREKLKDMNAEFMEKIEVLRIKEGRIGEFESKIGELQKKKHILSYKGTEMKKAMEPKEMQIDKLKIDLIRLKKEFEASLELKQKSVLLLEKSEKEKTNLEKLLAEETSETEREVNIFDSILSDIFNCLDAYQKVGDGKVFYKEFVKLFHRYISQNERGEPGSRARPGTKGVDELTRQVMHLEKSLFQLNKSNEKTVLRKNEEIYKRIKENTELVTNLNDIKKENKEILLKIRAKKEEIERLRALKGSQLAECSHDATAIRMFLQDEDSDDRTLMRPSVARLGTLPGKEGVQEAKKTSQKIECELISEVEFINERSQKMEFYIRDMKDRIKKHLLQFKCSPEIFLQESEEASEQH